MNVISKLTKKGRKLIYVVTEDWYFCSHRLSLAKEAVKQGYDVIVITQSSTCEALIEKSGIRLIPIKFKRSGRNILKDFMTMRTLLKIYQIEKPEIIHHISLKPSLYGSLMAILYCRKQSLQVVNTLTGLGYIFTSNKQTVRLLRFVIALLLRFVFSQKNSHLILQNRDDMSFLISSNIANEDKVSLIRGSGVDVDVFNLKKSERTTINIFLVARMLKDKGVEEFVAAASQLKISNGNVRFILIGDSDIENPSAIRIKSLEKWVSEGMIEWWGKCDDMENIYQHADIVVLPSYREGLPKVLLEAAACGLPIVATDVPGCREIVQDGINGILVPVKNSDALAIAIKKLIDEPELRESMGVKGRELVEKEFSQDKVIKETLALYEKIST